MAGKRAARIAAGGMLCFLGLRSASAQAEPVCTQPKTTCAGADGYYASLDDVNRLVAVSEPVLKELRACLDAAGGKHITPNVTIRWSSEGKAVSVKIDAPGYDTLPCVAKTSAKMSALQNPHETAIRCDYGCAKPAPPPPVPLAPPAPAPALAPAPPTPLAPPGVVVQPAAPSAAGPATAPDVPLEREWYGWQGLLLDAAAIGIFIGGWAADDGSIVGAGYFTYILGAPITHWAHANIGKGFGDMGMRIGIPLGGFIVGALFGYGAKQDGDGAFRNFGGHSNGAVLGAVTGAAIATVGMSALDALVFSYTKARPVKHDAWLRWQPTLDLRPGRGTVGVGGTF